jgi:IclR family pca regulon transcriptional regulator
MAQRSRSQRFDAIRVQSLERGLVVIGALGVPGPGRTVSEVASELAISRAAAYRLLGTLCNLGYVRAAAGRFALTPKVLELGYRQWSGLDLVDLAQPHLELLLDETAEACSMSILDGDAISCVARAAPARLICAAAGVGTRLPAYATAQGRVLLAALPSDELDACLTSADLRALTPATITRPPALRRELESVRRRGWALVDGELERGLRSIAVPITGGRQGMAAVGIVVDAHRVSLATMRRALPALQMTARRIERDLELGDSHRRWSSARGPVGSQPRRAPV